MIRNKKELKEYLAYEKALYFGGGNGSYLRAWLLRSKFYRIWQYLRTLRHAEYHKNRIFGEADSGKINSLWDKMAFFGTIEENMYWETGSVLKYRKTVLRKGF